MKYLLIIIFFFQTNLFSQNNFDTLNNKIKYQKPKPFSFLTNLPKDIVGSTKFAVSKKNNKKIAIVTGLSASLFLADQCITNSIHSFLNANKIYATEKFTPFIYVKIGGKPTNIGKIPKNINTAFYNIGQGSAVMFMAGGFYLVGKINKNNRALQTASQLTESFIALGLETQILKYATGRENPSDATTTRGKWRPFPKWKNFQNHKTQYDAYPSGHMATLISAITVVGQNYPEKKWIAPVGYSIAGLCALSMINNGVHWSSDFPLGFALGHCFAKYISKKAQFQLVY